ncbi:MAG: GspE/PulE family protein [Myxococcota bacterium]
MSSAARPRIGELLQSKGFLSDQQLENALARQRDAGGKLGEICIELGYLNEEQMVDVLALQLGVPRVQLSRYLIEPEVLSLVPAAAARRHRVIPLFRIDDTLTVAMADPLDVYAIDECKRHAGLEIDPMIATHGEIAEALRRHYRSAGGAREAVAEPGREPPARAPEDLARDAPVIKLVNGILASAVSSMASDIHIEPTPVETRVRLRVDGILQDAAPFPSHSHAAVVSRIKIMADLDIAEKRIPQDGRLQIDHGGRHVDTRVSTYPTVCGEKVVVRLLDKEQMRIDLESLGMGEETLKTLVAALRQPTGIILLTGPTGSGKTTTLYAALERIPNAERNIMTIEDPIEYYLEPVNQSQVNPKAGLTFATGLRAILRQDPDVIMVGEIRDQETAEIAVRAAMTGHLVFSTLHTNDAASALTRLVDLGLEPYLPASTVTAVLAQRLVRRVCAECTEPAEPAPETRDRLSEAEQSALRGLCRGRGCGGCNETGYSGRTGIFEILEMTSRLQALLSEKASAAALREAAVSGGMATLRQDGLRKAAEGITTIEEVVRVS